MNPIIQDLYTQIKKLYLQQELQEFHSKFEYDEEFQKINQQNTITQCQLESTEDRQILMNLLRNIINETKNAHKESLLQAQQFQIAQSEKEKVLNQIKIMKTQITDFENYRCIQDYQLELFQKYILVLEEDKKKNLEFVQSLQKELFEYQMQLEEAKSKKIQNSQENEELKENFKKESSMVEQRIQQWDQEIMKLEQSRLKKQNQIQQSIITLNNTLASDEEYSEQLNILKQEESLIDKHLNPYLEKYQEYALIEEKSKKLYILQKSETEKLIQQFKDYEQKNQNLKRIAEKSDIFIVQQIKEYQELLKILKQKQEQKQQLENLKSNLLNKLL